VKPPVNSSFAGWSNDPEDGFSFQRFEKVLLLDSAEIFMVIAR
jgi:hypothetical protein